MSQPLSAAAVALAVPFIARFEGFRARPYLCPAGIWSIGYGATRNADGSPVVPNGRIITQAQARAQLAAALERTAEALNLLLARAPSVPQYAALLSLAYNIGVNALARSALLEKFNAGDIAGAADEFLAWDKAHIGGRLVCLPGLKRRRAAEYALFLGGNS